MTGPTAEQIATELDAWMASRFPELDSAARLLIGRRYAEKVAALIAEAVEQARAASWDECVDRICSPDESGTANNARFKRANPYRGEVSP